MLNRDNVKKTCKNLGPAWFTMLLPSDGNITPGTALLCWLADMLEAVGIGDQIARMSMLKDPDLVKDINELGEQLAQKKPDNIKSCFFSIIDRQLFLHNGKAWDVQGARVQEIPSTNFLESITYNLLLLYRRRCDALKNMGA